MKPPVCPQARATAAWSALEPEAARTLEPFRDALAPIAALSPYLAGLLERHPEIAFDCLSSGPETVLDEAFATARRPVEGQTTAARLRLAKRHVALACALADLCGTMPTMEVTGRLSDFADLALAEALEEAKARLRARGRLNEGAGGISVVALGKHGARELNYSSDIDVVVLFDPHDPVFPDPAEALDTSVRVTRELVRLMQERNAVGYVFRTDLRLRPDPGSMPLAISLAMAEVYYETRGQNWERAAWIKARHAAGDEAVSRAALDMLRPFVWRRYLDFAAIADIHSIKRQIQAHRDILDLHVPGHNVKLGRGGIREIEFFVQTQQLIAGGRDERLRGRRTLDMLTALEGAGWIEPTVGQEMAESYLYLRDVEHRLQMVDDRQTHSLPDDPDALADIAHLCGFDDVDAFTERTRAHLVRTEAHYASLFADEPDLGFEEGNLAFTGDDPDPDTVATLAALGFARPADMIAVVKGWHFGRAPALRSASARERLTELVPQLLRSFAGRDDPDAALLAFDGFVGGLPAGLQLFALLEANPRLTNLLLDILADAPRMAELIGKRPHILDAVIEPRFFSDLPGREELTALIGQTLDQAVDYEAMLDRARVFASEQRLLVSIRLMGGAITPAAAGRAYSLLAELVLAAVLERVHAEFAERHGHVPGARMAIVAMGRLGSGELTADSDLDLVFVTDREDMNAMSDGPHPVAAAQYEIRLVKRLIAAMSAPTSVGRLYELDFRLRPSGNSGPLATTLRNFEEHQTGRAKVWEHLALTRARPIAGDVRLMGDITAAIEQALRLPRDRADTAREVREMRALMDDERPPHGPFDVKLAPGGLIDLEFIAQFALLVGEVPLALRNRSAAEVLTALGEAALAEAYELFTTVLQMKRLGLPDGEERLPSGLVSRIVDVCGVADETALRALLDETRVEVRVAFDRVLGAA